MKIEILNPKAKNILNGLADLNLIKITKEPEEKDFIALLKKMRKQYDPTPDLNEITEEVEQVRKIRNEK